MGLGDRLTHRPSELSGGQQQRVACARALATRPEIIFADEPTGNLDSRSGAEVLGFLRRSVDEFGQTIVMVTHDAHAAAYADRVVFLADGVFVDETPRPGRTGDPRAHDDLRAGRRCPRLGGLGAGEHRVPGTQQRVRCRWIRRRPRRSPPPSRAERMLKATWRSLKAHKARMLLSGLAVVLGVAFVVGTFIFTDTLKGTFDELFSNDVPDVVVTQQLEVGADDGRGSVVSTVPQSVLDEVRDLPGRGQGDRRRPDPRRDPARQGRGAHRWQRPAAVRVLLPRVPRRSPAQRLSLVEGRAPTAPEEIVVDLQTAEKGGFKVGDTVTVVTQGPRIEAPLVGLARYGVSGGLAGQPSRSSTVSTPRRPSSGRTPGTRSPSSGMRAPRPRGCATT